MKYFLYLRRSFTRAWREHLLLVLLLSCAMSLPLCMSEVFAGKRYGVQLQNEYYTGGHNYEIRFAESGDEKLFANVPGTVTVWDNGALYVDRTPENPLTWENGYPNKEALYDAISQLVDNAKRYDLSITALEGMMTDEAEFRISPLVWTVVLLFSIFIESITYALFWRRKSEEIRQLKNIGACSGQIRNLLLVNTWISQLLASVCACLVSSAAVWFVTKRHLGASLSDTTGIVFLNQNWVVFRISWKETAFVVLVLFGYALLQTVIQSRIYTGERLAVSRRNRITFPLCMWKRPCDRTVLRRIFCRIQRFQRYLYAFIAIPVLAAAVLLMQLREDVDAVRANFPTAGIRVLLRHSEEGYTNADLAPLTEIDGVAEIMPEYNELRDYHVWDPQFVRVEESEERDLCPFQAKINVIEMPEEKTGRESGEPFQAVVDAEHVGIYEMDENGEIQLIEKADYAPGDILQIHAFGKHYFSVEIAALLDVESAYALRKKFYENDPREAYLVDEPGARIVYIYVSPEDYAQICSLRKVASFQVRLTDMDKNVAVERAILDYLQGEAILSLQNYCTNSEIAYRRAVGMNLLYTTLSVLLYVFFAVITTLSLIDYAMAHKNTIRILHMQGAPHGAILAAFAEIMLPPGLLTCAAVWAIVPPVVREYYRLRGYTEAYIAKLDMGFTGGGVAVLIAAVAVFVLPVLCTVARLLRELDDA